MTYEYLYVYKLDSSKSKQCGRHFRRDVLEFKEKERCCVAVAGGRWHAATSACSKSPVFSRLQVDRNHCCRNVEFLKTLVRTRALRTANSTELICTHYLNALRASRVMRIPKGAIFINGIFSRDVWFGTPAAGKLLQKPHDAGTVLSVELTGWLDRLGLHT